VLENLADAVNANAPLLRRGQYLDTVFLVQVGTRNWIVTVEKGRIASVAPERLAITPWAFALRASQETWTAFWDSAPKPGFHDLMALVKGRHLKVEGDVKTFMSNLRYIKDVLGTLRHKQSGVRA
jgi:hypothetical protein